MKALLMQDDALTTNLNADVERLTMTLHTLGIVALLGLLFVLGLKFMDLTPAPAEGEHAQAEPAEPAAPAAEGGHT